MIDKYISVPQAADIIGCTVNRVRQLIGEGKIRAEKLNDRAWAVVADDVHEYADAEQTTGRPRVGRDS